MRGIIRVHAASAGCAWADAADDAMASKALFPLAKVECEVVKHPLVLEVALGEGPVDALLEGSHVAVVDLLGLARPQAVCERLHEADRSLAVQFRLLAAAHGCDCARCVAGTALAGASRVFSPPQAHDA